MFYWGLLTGLIIGANIGIVMAGLFWRSSSEEHEALGKPNAAG
jgi:hypothetical protein